MFYNQSHLTIHHPKFDKYFNCVICTKKHVNNTKSRLINLKKKRIVRRRRLTLLKQPSKYKVPRVITRKDKSVIRKSRVFKGIKSNKDYANKYLKNVSNMFSSPIDSGILFAHPDYDKIFRAFKKEREKLKWQTRKKSKSPKNEQNQQVTPNGLLYRNEPRVGFNTTQHQKQKVQQPDDSQTGPWSFADLDQKVSSNKQLFGSITNFRHQASISNTSVTGISRKDSRASTVLPGNWTPLNENNDELPSRSWFNSRVKLVVVKAKQLDNDETVQPPSHNPMRTRRKKFREAVPTIEQPEEPPTPKSPINRQKTNLSTRPPPSRSLDRFSDSRLDDKEPWNSDTHVPLPPPPKKFVPVERLRIPVNFKGTPNKTKQVIKENVESPKLIPHGATTLFTRVSPAFVEVKKKSGEESGGRKQLIVQETLTPVPPPPLPPPLRPQIQPQPLRPLQPAPSSQQPPEDITRSRITYVPGANPKNHGKFRKEVSSQTTKPMDQNHVIEDNVSIMDPANNTSKCPAYCIPLVLIIIIIGGLILIALCGLIIGLLYSRSVTVN